MEHWNQTLFLLLNVAPGASGAVVEAARLLAEGSIWIIPVGMVFGWLRGSIATRHALVAAAASGLTGLLINQLIAIVWTHPRPFVVGIGQTLLTHVPDSSFPSDHLTLIWTVAFSLMSYAQSRHAGWALALLGLPVAWARIYLGVHFPMDMLGAALVAFGSVWTIRRVDQRFVAPLTQAMQRAHQRAFAGLIEKGWVRP